MSRISTAHTYGRRTGGRTKPLLFQTELPISPTDKKTWRQMQTNGSIDDIAEQLTLISLDDTITLEHLDFDITEDFEEVAAKVEAVRLHAAEENKTEDDNEDRNEKKEVEDNLLIQEDHDAGETQKNGVEKVTRTITEDTRATTENHPDIPDVDSSEILDTYDEDSIEAGLRVLTWADMCPPGDRIEKIAEASYAEVYRVTNERGTSIIKAIRLASPIKPKTKQQVRSGLVDEQPHDEDDLRGELAISEWLADIPGFVIYKERYIVRGRAPKDLLETHQTFQRRAKRQDPGRLQFYPSPSRYLNETQFLVIELGDAGQALEDVMLESVSQLWDVFLHVAIALARAEDQISFEHRDLHEGNLCVRQVAQPCDKKDSSPVVFGYSGLDITILDYGLSRAEDVDVDGRPDYIACDLEKDLSLFTSTHADQCKVYRQMRSYLLKGDRVHLPPECHQIPYDEGPDGQPISWKSYSPYTNVLWLAYLYSYLVRNYCGNKGDLARFRRASHELWMHINPDAPPAILSFSSATDVVRFAVEAGWVTEAQLVGGGNEDSFCSRHDKTDIDWSLLQSEAADDSYNCNESIIEAHTMHRDESEPRRSPRRRRPVVRYE